jgi:hypothetical protein
MSSQYFAGEWMCVVCVLRWFSLLNHKYHSNDSIVCLRLHSGLFHAHHMLVGVCAISSIDSLLFFVFSLFCLLTFPLSELVSLRDVTFERGLIEP